MDTQQILKKYFKFALPIAVIILVLENTFQPNTYLNGKLTNWTKGYPLDFFLLQRGGSSRDSAHGYKYFEDLNLKVYNKTTAESMPLKEFTVQHIREYEAALFLDLA